MSKEVAKEFLSALNNACGEIDQAAAHARDIFAGDELKEVRRELARLMEQVDSRIIPVLKRHYPDLDGFVS